MSTPTYRHEPAERDDPLNTELDRIERAVSRLLATEAAAPLRARLARLLPECAGPQPSQPAPTARRTRRRTSTGLVARTGLDPIAAFVETYTATGNGAAAWREAFGPGRSSTYESEQGRRLLRRPDVIRLLDTSRSAGPVPTLAEIHALASIVLDKTEQAQTRVLAADRLAVGLELRAARHGSAFIGIETRVAVVAGALGKGASTETATRNGAAARSSP